MNIETIVELQIPPLPYYLGSGRSDFQIGEHHPNRRNLGIYDLLVVVKGELHVGENGLEWTLVDGDTLLLLPDGEHYSVKPCAQETVFYWVHFEHTGRHQGSEAKNSNGALHASRPFGNPYTLRLPKYSRLTNPHAAYDLIQLLLALSIDTSFWEEQRLLTELLAMLEEGEAGGLSSAAARVAQRTAAYIQNNYRSKITNEIIAKALHFHPNYIVRCMKSKYGSTPIHYLHKFQIEHAKRHLITTEWSIDRIADEVGFRYAPHFSACFKRIVGLSPLQFRKQYLH